MKVLKGVLMTGNADGEVTQKYPVTDNGKTR